MNAVMVLTQRKKFGDEKLTTRYGVCIVITMRDLESYSPKNVLKCVLRCPTVKKQLITKEKLVPT